MGREVQDHESDENVGDECKPAVRDGGVWCVHCFPFQDGRPVGDLCCVPYHMTMTASIGRMALPRPVKTGAREAPGLRVPGLRVTWMVRPLLRSRGGKGPLSGDRPEGDLRRTQGVSRALRFSAAHHDERDDLRHASRFAFLERSSNV